MGIILYCTLSPFAVVTLDAYRLVDVYLRNATRIECLLVFLYLFTMDDLKIDHILQALNDFIDEEVWGGISSDESDQNYNAENKYIFNILIIYYILKFVFFLF